MFQSSTTRGTTDAAGEVKVTNQLILKYGGCLWLLHMQSQIITCALIIGDKREKCREGGRRREAAEGEAGESLSMRRAGAPLLYSETRGPIAGDGRSALWEVRACPS